MSDTHLHTDNDPFIDDDYTYSRPALPPYAAVLAALGNPVDALAAIATLNAESQLYRSLLQRLLGGDDIAYSEIEYALEGERPGEDIVKALADVKAERDRLRDQLHERMEDIAARGDNILRPVYQAAGTDPQMSEPNDIVRRIQELEAQAEVGALLERIRAKVPAERITWYRWDARRHGRGFDHCVETLNVDVDAPTFIEALRAAVAAMEDV